MIYDMTDTQNPLRLRKKHGSGRATPVTAADGKRLLDSQSLRNAIVAGLIVILVFSLLWISLSELTNRVFPWMTVLLGFLIGHGVRLAGRGIDWRFPAVAAFMAVAGSLLANIVVAASVTAEGFGTGTLDVLAAVTSMTWPVFFDEKVSFADIFYAAVAAAIAAFYANRRLTRSQYRAVRLLSEEQRHD